MIAAVLLLAGCSSDDSAAPSTAGTASGDTAPGAAEPVGDACAMLTDDDITPLIGPHPAGKSTDSDRDAPTCVWENPDTLTSVTLSIGAPDTAINGTLPPLPEGIPATPGPDGMRFLSSGMVEFEADKRDNTVQVATLQPADEVNAQAVALATKVAALLDK